MVGKGCQCLKQLVQPGGEVLVPSIVLQAMQDSGFYLSGLDDVGCHGQFLRVWDLHVKFMQYTTMECHAKALQLRIRRIQDSG